MGAMSSFFAINTQWTQDRVVNAGYADAEDDQCMLCGTEPGAIVHRHSRTCGGVVKLPSIGINCLARKLSTMLKTTTSPACHQ